MSLLDRDSCDCARSELELFTIPPTQTSIEESRFEPYYPLTSLDRSGPIEFKIISSEDTYLDLNQSFLYFKAKITDRDGQDLKRRVSNTDNTIPDLSSVIPINYSIGTFFERLEVLIANKTVGSTDSLYAYRSYIETLLSYGYEAKHSHLIAGMYHQDIDDLHEHVANDLTANSNKGAKKRWDRTKFSQSFECLGPIHNEMFEQQKLLLSKLPVYLKLHRSNVNFALMARDADAQYSIVFEKAILYVNMKKIASHVRLAHEERLLNTNAKYPVRRVEMKFFTRAANRADLSEPNLVNGILPKRVIIGMVNTVAFNSSLHHNPLAFEDMNVSMIGLRKNGQQYPFNTLNLDIPNDEYMMGYYTLMNATNMWLKDRNNALIPTRDFKKGYALFGFNLAPDDSIGGHFNLVREGNLSLDLRLRTGHNQSITIICYLEYDSIVEISSNRTVIYNE